MRLVIFGLSVSSSWGNGHATLWRGLIGALARRGHEVVFFERDVPYYAAARDLVLLEHGSRLLLYADWDEARRKAERAVRDADAAIVTSYCPDACAAAQLVQRSRALGVFYDLDAPVTLAAISEGVRPSYIPTDGLSGFDLVLSYGGGRAVSGLASELGARRVAPLYGHADAETLRPAAPDPSLRADLVFPGTYASDRQDTLAALFVEPARARPDLSFLIAGAGYGPAFPWQPNIHYKRHLAPGDHSVLYASSRLTLNVTRAAMAAYGHAPSGRLFEAALAGAAIVSDAFEGLETFFEPGKEILVARSSEDVLAALALPDAALAALGQAARARVLAEHTSQTRADELIRLLSEAMASQLRASLPRHVLPRGVSCGA